MTLDDGTSSLTNVQTQPRTNSEFTSSIWRNFTLWT